MNCVRSNRSWVVKTGSNLGYLPEEALCLTTTPHYFPWKNFYRLAWPTFPTSAPASHSQKPSFDTSDFPIWEHLPPFTSEILYSPDSASVTAPPLSPPPLLLSLPYPKGNVLSQNSPCQSHSLLRLQLSPPHSYPNLYLWPDHFLRLSPIFLISLSILQPDV